MELRNTPQIILDQLNTMDKRALWAWGTSNFKGQKESLKYTESLGYLTFEARNNPKFPEKVVIKIQLEFNDTYTVKVYKYNKELVELTQVDVYCDQLVNVIDDILG